jgi:hypothetical protein
MVKIGITERGDAGLDFIWMRTAKDYDGVILITKHLSHKFIEEAARINSIVHATITGYGGSIYEPNVPKLIMSKIYFDLLVEKIGAQRVILRIDPIIPDDRGIAIAINVYEQFHIKSGKKTRVRISFLDQYPHVKERFIKVGLKPLDYQFHAPIELRKKIAAYFPDAEICGEPGMECVGCVSEKDLKVLGIDAVPLQGYDRIKAVQRPECKCLIYKTEMLKTKGQCPHGCIYCYWK